MMSAISNKESVYSKLSEQKNMHTPVYGIKEFVCLYVCLSVTHFGPNYLRTGKTFIFKVFMLASIPPSPFGNQWKLINVNLKKYEKAYSNYTI